MMEGALEWWIAAFERSAGSETALLKIIARIDAMQSFDMGEIPYIPLPISVAVLSPCQWQRS